MKLFSVGGAEIRCSPFLLIVIPLAVVMGNGRLVLAALLSLCLHESAHASAAHRLGYRVFSVEAQPFGFVARMDMSGASPCDAAAVYAAGPTASLALAAFSALFEDIVPAYAEAGLGLTEYNLVIFAVNLLPSLPLDGGRLLLAAFSGRSRRTASLVLRTSGVVTGCAFVGAFTLLIAKGSLNLTLLVMGVFLVAAALAERDETRIPRFARRPLRPGMGLAVRACAMHGDTRLSDALARLPSDGYAVITILDGFGRRVAELDEKQLFEACERLGARATLLDAAGKKVTGNR